MSSLRSIARAGRFLRPFDWSLKRRPLPVKLPYPVHQMLLGGRVKASAGLSLIEVALALALIGIMFGGYFQAQRVQIEAQQQQAIKSELQKISNALTLYVSRNAALPCPADASLSISNPNAGISQASSPCPLLNASGVPQYVAVPWKTLGLSPDETLDPWGRKIAYIMYSANTYGVQPGVSSTYLPITTQYCRCPGAQCQAGATPLQNQTTPLAYCVNSGANQFTQYTNDWLFDRGLTVYAPTSTVPTQTSSGTALLDPTACSSSNSACSGAAFVLISYGRDGYGAYTREGSRIAVPTAIDPYDAVNTMPQNKPSGFPFSYTQASTFYTSYGLTPPTSTFQDVVLGVSIDSLTCSAHLRSALCKK